MEEEDGPEYRIILLGSSSKTYITGPCENVLILFRWDEFWCRVEEEEGLEYRIIVLSSSS